MNYRKEDKWSKHWSQTTKNIYILIDGHEQDVNTPSNTLKYI